jgi:5-methylcytosine-specific restriction endonuclease McrA
VCSNECKKELNRIQSRNAKHSYEARRRSSYVEAVWHNKVYERDGYRCGICNKKVRMDKEVPHPLAPTLDHIVPISLGGEHSYANIRTAHFNCNSKRSNNMNPNGEQQFLFG